MLLLGLSVEILVIISSRGAFAKNTFHTPTATMGRERSLRHIIGRVDSSDSSDSSVSSDSSEEFDLDNGTVATSLSHASSLQDSTRSMPLPPMSTMAGASKSPGHRQRSIFMPTRTSLTNALISPVRAARRLTLSGSSHSHSRNNNISRSTHSTHSPTSGSGGSGQGRIRRSSTTTSDFLTSREILEVAGRGRKSFIEKAGDSVKRMSLRRPHDRDDNHDDDDDLRNYFDGSDLPTDGVSRNEILAALVCRELEMMDD
jgi:hypothetical protein